jgi:hypothetical protein
VRQHECVERGSAEAIAGALARVRAARRRVDRARVALKDAAMDLERELRDAHALGSSVSELEQPSGLPQSHIHDLVTRPPRKRPSG